MLNRMKTGDEATTAPAAPTEDPQLAVRNFTAFAAEVGHAVVDGTATAATLAAGKAVLDKFRGPRPPAPPSGGAAESGPQPQAQGE
jgi:hypothetical protein